MMTAVDVPIGIRPSDLAAWLASFPTASSFELARALARYLTPLDRTEPALDKRLQVLETLSARTDLVLRELADVYGKSPQPMGAHAREALDLARKLAFTVARSYKAAALERAKVRMAVGAGKKLAPLVLKAMRYVAEGMRGSYKAYSRVPKGAWDEMHQLYLCAEQAGIATGVADAEGKASIAEFYCESLLLSLTDPYRLVPGEVEAIEALIRELRAPVSVGQELPETRASCHFLVPCDEDAPPRPLRDGNNGVDGSSVRVFDASALVDALRARNEQAAGDADADDRAALITKLILLWDDPPRRAFRRDPAQGSVAICVGVKPIAHFVAHDATTDGEAETKALRQGITMPLRALPEDESGAAIPIHEWAVINLSARGLKVRRSATTAYPITVGEVVGIRAPGKVLWTIGVTRWITALEDGTTEFGVQFFASAVCAVWVRNSSPSSPRKLGLLVADGEENSDESVLTPPNTYSDSAEFELRGEGYRSRVRASGLIERNTHFDLFKVVPS
jgi:hypothetical protein